MRMSNKAHNLPHVLQIVKQRFVEKCRPFHLSCMKAPLLLLAVSLVITSCDPYRKAATSTNLEKKLEAARYYYNRGDYAKAQPILFELLTVYRGTDKGEPLYFNYADTYMQMGDYQIASFHFKNFADNYPNSPLAEQALFLYAQALAYDSAPKELDQQSTHAAIDAFQLFINKYPRSARVDSSNAVIDDLRQKLENKALSLSS